MLRKPCDNHLSSILKGVIACLPYHLTNGVKAKLNPKDNLEIELDEQGRLVITKKDLLSDRDDLIRRDLVSEGRSEHEVETLVAQRKRELGKALLKMSDHAETEIAKGEYTSLEQLKRDLDSEA